MKQKNEPKKAVFNWSGGKDSALALRKILQDEDYEIIALLTTFSAESSLSSAHSIPLSLIQQQADSIGVELYPVFVSKAPNDYHHKMLTAIQYFKEKGVAHFVFGDLYLEDVRLYRENQLYPHGIEVVMPLWGKTPYQIIQLFLESGIKAKIVTTQANILDASFIGKELDQTLVNLLPKDIDVCGENGEYHTITYGGDIFKKEIDVGIVKPYKLSFDYRLDTGEPKTYEYWQAKFTE